MSRFSTSKRTPARPVAACSGMFTANSMNCLAEALGLALPGNGSTLATHADRKNLFLEAGRKIVEITKASLRSVKKKVFSRVRSRPLRPLKTPWRWTLRWVDRPIRFCTLLAIALEGEVDFHHGRHGPPQSRKVPCLCKVAPNIENVHMEDVHRAGGIFSILGELSRGGLLHNDVTRPFTQATMGRSDCQMGRKGSQQPRGGSSCSKRRRVGSAPRVAFSTQENRFKELDTDRDRAA